MTEQAKETVEFYCVKCRSKCIVLTSELTHDMTVKGRRRIGASCSMCGTKMSKFVKRSAP